MNLSLAERKLTLSNELPLERDDNKTQMDSYLTAQSSMELALSSRRIL